MEQEGVIQFTAEHESRDLAAPRFGSLVAELSAWRRIFVQTELLGVHPTRYGGLGFGNLSGRCMPLSSPRGKRGFAITGSQTGKLEVLGLAHYAHVISYSIRGNTVSSHGLSMPSSESMTHGAFYDLSPAIRYVFHVHAPSIWQHAARLRLPTSDPGVPYGTQAMAEEVQRLYRETALAERRVMAMGGHTDGIISFGRCAEEAGLALLSVLARAYQ